MIYTYNECLEKYGSQYNIRKNLKAGTLFQLEKGIYSEKRYNSVLEVISKKYPKGVFTMNSAFYYHNLTDVIPEKYYLKTDINATKIRDERVVQIFENSDVLQAGAEKFTYNGVEITMYNRERMLVELLRCKNKLPFDYYKEILSNYRKIIDQLDIPLIQDYAYAVPKSGMIMEALQMEVF